MAIKRFLSQQNSLELKRVDTNRKKIQVELKNSCMRVSLLIAHVLTLNCQYYISNQSLFKSGYPKVISKANF